MMTIQRNIREARTNMDVAWREMLTSVERFTEAEAIFNDSTQAFRVRHRIPDGERMTVECIMARGRDPIWQESVSDCRYFRDRTMMFATVHSAALERLRELLEDEKTSI